MPKPTMQSSRRLNYANLVKAINAVTTQLQSRAAAAVNQALVLRNWLVGAYIIEYEQAGKDRAKYGTKLLETLAADLKLQGNNGLNTTLLKLCRQCYQTYPQIGPTLSDQLVAELPFGPTLPQRTVGRIPKLESQETGLAVPHGTPVCRETASVPRSRPRPH